MSVKLVIWRTANNTSMTSVFIHSIQTTRKLSATTLKRITILNSKHKYCYNHFMRPSHNTTLLLVLTHSSKYRYWKNVTSWSHKPILVKGFIIMMVRTHTHTHTLSPHSIAFRYIYYFTSVTIYCWPHNRGDLHVLGQQILWMCGFLSITLCIAYSWLLVPQRWGSVQILS